MHWHLPGVVCHFYCLLDVAASTASIVHLVLISSDRLCSPQGDYRIRWMFRLVAATKPAEYKTLKHRKRVYISIVIAWVFSIFISLALPIGKH